MRTYMVHGYRYDPAARVGHPDNPHTELFPMWAGYMDDRLQPVGYGWYSAPPGWRSRLRTWRAGQLRRYAYAWHLAEQRGLDLRHLLLNHADSRVVCHSLGGRLTMEALDTNVDMSPYVSRVLILSGAEHVDRCATVARRQPGVRFFNVAVSTDFILEFLGAWFSPAPGRKNTVGHAGLGSLAPDNWFDIHLDSPHDQRWALTRGWEIVGDDRTEIWDHHVSYNERNWDLYNAFLTGDFWP